MYSKSGQSLVVVVAYPLFFIEKQIVLSLIWSGSNGGNDSFTHLFCHFVFSKYNKAVNIIILCEGDDD